MPSDKTTIQTNQDSNPKNIKDELSRAIYVTFQLEALSKQMGERNDSAAKHEARMEAKFESIERKLNEIPEKYVSKEYFNERLESMNKDVESINKNINKLVWLVMTAVVMALMGLVLMNPPRIGGL